LLARRQSKAGAVGDCSPFVDQDDQTVLTIEQFLGELMQAMRILAHGLSQRHSVEPPSADLA
jgi:hypothetical protein